jgi:LPPG:FO 2-phospho-L-lactate transferase
VAAHYSELIDGYVLDDRDAEQADDVRALGLSVRVTDSIMVDPAAAERLARVALALADERIGAAP